MTITSGILAFQRQVCTVVALLLTNSCSVPPRLFPLSLSLSLSLSFLVNSRTKESTVSEGSCSHLQTQCFERNTGFTLMESAGLENREFLSCPNLFDTLGSYSYLRDPPLHAVRKIATNLGSA